MSKTSVENPFARGRMPLDSRMMTCAGNQFLGHDEHLISTARVVAVHYGSYNIQTFGRAWGNILLFEGGNLQEVGYLNYDAILALRDLGSRVYEVRYGEQETAWDDASCGKYEYYGKRVRDGVVTLVKWGDCAERWINLTAAEDAELCAGIEKMPDHHAYFEHYRTRVRPAPGGSTATFYWRVPQARVVKQSPSATGTDGEARDTADLSCHLTEATAGSMVITFSSVSPTYGRRAVLRCPSRCCSVRASGGGGPMGSRPGTRLPLISRTMRKPCL